MLATEPYQAGDVDAAVQAALQDVKKNPSDIDRRGLLCEMLCFAGDIERADKQLETIANADPKAALGVAMFRQQVRSEMARREFFEAGRVPEFIGEPTDVLKLHLQASIALRENDPAEAVRLLSEAEEKRPRVSGRCNGEPFEDFRDLDDLTASFFEVLTSTGKYYWIPFERVKSVEFRPIGRPRDLVWRRAEMSVAGGPEGEVFLPALYYGTHKTEDNQLRLGRGTDWSGEEGEVIRGQGLRIFLVGSEDKTMTQLETIEFDVEDPPEADDEAA